MKGEEKEEEEDRTCLMMEPRRESERQEAKIGEEVVMVGYVRGEEGRRDGWISKVEEEASFWSSDRCAVA